MVTPSALLATAADAVQNVRTNELDPAFLTKALVLLIVLLGVVATVLGIIAFFRRKPSTSEQLTAFTLQLAQAIETAKEAKGVMEDVVGIGVKLARIEESMAGLHRHVAEIDGRLREGDEVMSKLRERQAANAESLATVKTDVHEMRMQIMQLIRSSK